MFRIVNKNELICLNNQLNFYKMAHQLNKFCQSSVANLEREYGF